MKSVNLSPEQILKMQSLARENTEKCILQNKTTKVDIFYRSNKEYNALTKITREIDKNIVSSINFYKVPIDEHETKKINLLKNLVQNFWNELVVEDEIDNLNVSMNSAISNYILKDAKYLKTPFIHINDSKNVSVQPQSIQEVMKDAGLEKSYERSLEDLNKSQKL